MSRRLPQRRPASRQSRFVPDSNETGAPGGVDWQRGEQFDFNPVADATGAPTLYLRNSMKSLGDPIHRDSVWRQRQELKRYFTRRGWKPVDADGLEACEAGHGHEGDDSVILAIVTRANRERLGGDAGVDDVLREFFINSQVGFEALTGALLQGDETYDPEAYEVGADQYSHIRHFGWIYAVEIRLLRRILAETPDREVVVIDAGTGFGHFVFTAARFLSHDERRRTRFVGTDHTTTDLKFAMDAAHAAPGLNVTWEIADIDGSDHVQRLKDASGGRFADLLVVNHVLEHLEARPAVDYVLDWLRVARTLVVTVPLEDRLENSVSAHRHEFCVDSLARLAAEVERRAGGLVTADLTDVRGGIVVFRHDLQGDTGPRAVELIGYETLAALAEVYRDVWGRDAYRLSDEPIRATTVALVEVLEALLTIAAEGEIGCEIAVTLARALQYTRGVTDEHNVMRRVDPGMLREIARRWSANCHDIGVLALAKDVHGEARKLFRGIAAEWATYLDFLELAQHTTGRFDVDSFEGVAEEAIELAQARTPDRSRADVEQELSTHARRAYEQADLLGLGVVHELMRVPFARVATMLREARWEALLHCAVRAELHGEGRFRQILTLCLDAAADPALREAFWTLVSTYVGVLQLDYRTRRPLGEVDLHAVLDRTTAFLSAAHGVDVPDSFDVDEAWLKARQARLRLAESHLQAVEAAYAVRRSPDELTTANPAELYREAMLFFLTGLDGIRDGHGLAEVLLEYRRRLIEARHCADSRYAHDYVLWAGPGDDVGQSRARALHPRVQLYQLEAYAERMFMAGELVRRDLAAGTLRAEESRAAYEWRVEFDESAMYAHEWIARLGPRRSVIFGHSPPPTIPENAGILERDAWVRGAHHRILGLGGDPQLWGTISTGYTERLRTLIQGDDDTSVRASLEALLAEAGPQAFAAAVRHVDPYECHTVGAHDSPPAVTVGLHIHNARPSVIVETLVHLRELDWLYEARWCVISSTSSDRVIAKAEHRMALELGLSRIGITNRQLLKGGNQNRTMLNTPRPLGRESFYFTLDDDFVPAPLTLRRAVPILLHDRTAGFVQLPLLFRASLEPGHSFGRQMDASLMLSFCELTAPALNAPAMSLPLGTNTLFRTTRGRSAIEATGGMVVDAVHGFTAEDHAFGVMATLMGRRPSPFATPSGGWTDGVHLTEAWLVGDGVDFAPGGQLQKERWSEGHARILRMMFLPYFSRTRGRPAFRGREIAGLATILTGYASMALMGLLTLLLLPVLAFTPAARDLAVLDGLWLSSYAALLWIIPGALQVYMSRDAGLTVRDVVGMSVMIFYGTCLSIVRGTVRGLFMRPTRAWRAFKGRRAARKLQVVHLGLGIAHLAAAVLAVWQGLWMAVVYAVSAVALLSLWGFHGLLPAHHAEKVERMARDANETLWKVVSRRLSFPRGRLGAPVAIPAVQARLFWRFWCSLAIAGVVTMHVWTAIAAQRLTTMSTLVAFGMTCLLSLLMFRRVAEVWIWMRGRQLRDAVRQRAPLADANWVRARIASYENGGRGHRAARACEEDGRHDRGPRTSPAHRTVRVVWTNTLVTRGDLGGAAGRNGAGARTRPHSGSLTSVSN